MLELFPDTLRLCDVDLDVDPDGGGDGGDVPSPGRAFDRHGLAMAIARRAAAMRAAGAGAGDNIVIGQRTGSAFIIDLLAAWRLGACAVAVTPTLTAGERARVAEATGARLWCGEAGQGTGEGSGKGADLPLLPPAPAGLRSGPASVDEARSDVLPASCGASDPDAPALVLMTSGTTATPKGVVHTRRSLMARLALNLAHMDAGDLERTLCVLPMHFGHGLIGNSLTPMAAGASLTLWPEPGIAGFARLGEVIDAGGITFLSSVPAMWRIVLRASPPPRRGTLRRVHVGSAPLSARLWEAIADWAGTRRVVNMFGTTETANWIGGHSLEEGAADGLVGRPWGGAVRVLQPDGTLAGTGEGEVAVASPSCMTGYLGQPKLTAAACCGDFFLTGDRGRIDAAGRLRLIGRRRNEINRGGIKIPAEEIDLLLEGHPAVAAACAFALDDPVGGEAVAAAVAPLRAGTVSEAELLAWCAARIRAEARPQRLFLVEALPLDARGKLDRDAIRKDVLAAQGTRERR